MAIDLTSKHEVSWKDKLLGNGISNPKTSSISIVNGNEDDLILLEGDVRKSTLNGIPTIELSEMLQQLLVMDMATTMVVKLLGWNIGYAALFNFMSSLWKPSSQFQLMDSNLGPWTLDFNPLQPFPNVAIAWICLPNLSGFFYKRKILEEIGGLVGKVAKLDFMIDKGSSGRFPRMAVYVNLDQPLVLQILINVKTQ
ncbi:hypothetical protein Gotri_015936 [Gossypium trilobum]|uniref:DUF4283 domain-containing protein n=1 Tax=Gossypium trilobum TaxID=34281 RepID=A0A7J9E1Q7_9ROSI|nr:hypothetical protein [Gossypium trilobum]